MSALAVLAVVALQSAPSAARELDLEAGFSAGIGNRVALGALVALDSRWKVWGGPKVSGGVEVSLIAGYQNEPYAFTAPLFQPAEITGANHRIQALVAIGHGLRVMRFTVGTHLFAGWTSLSAVGRLRHAATGIDQPATATASELTVGVVLHARLRLTDSLSLSARVFAPLPNLALGVSPWVTASLGLAVTL